MRQYTRFNFETGLTTLSPEDLKKHFENQDFLYTESHQQTNLYPSFHLQKTPLSGNVYQNLTNPGEQSYLGMMITCPGTFTEIYPSELKKLLEVLSSEIDFRETGRETIRVRKN